MKLNITLKPFIYKMLFIPIFILFIGLFHINQVHAETKSISFPVSIISPNEDEETNRKTNENSDNFYIQQLNQAYHQLQNKLKSNQKQKKVAVNRYKKEQAERKRKAYRYQFVQKAKSKLGCPYVWGAIGPNIFDCSGLTQWIYRQMGKIIPRTSIEQKNGGKVISLSQAEPGDIVWRPGHVGLYIGNGKVIHAPHTGAVVSYTSASGFSCAIRYI